MSFIEVSVANDEQTRVTNNERARIFRCAPAKCAEKTWLRMVLLGFIVVGASFGGGIALGFGIHALEKKGAPQPTCGDFEEAPDVREELEHGVDTLAEWFPEMDDLKENKADIVDQIAAGDAPSQNFLQKVLAWTKKIRLPSWRPGQPGSSSKKSNIFSRVLQRGANKTDSSASLVERRLSSDACLIAVTDFICATMEWLTGFVMYTVPEKYRAALVTALRTTRAKFKFAQMTEHIADFVAADGSKKAKAVWQILKGAWDAKGGWLKFLFRELIGQVRANPWEVMRVIVTLAARFAFWFEKGMNTFVGSVTFQLLNAKEMLDTGKKALKDCSGNSEAFDRDRDFGGKFGIGV